MTSTRSAMRDQINEHLLPELHRRGFNGPARIGGNSLLHEFRRLGSRGAEVLNVQFEKRGLPRFVLGLYVEPAESMEAVIARGGTVISGLLKPEKAPFTRHWFRADPTLWRRIISPKVTYER